MRELETALLGLRGAVRAYRTPAGEESDRALRVDGRRGIGVDPGWIAADRAEAVHARFRRRLALLRAMAIKALGYRR